ncbi:MAG: alpha/beta hydrolase family protein [Kofleriaceae bacterium]
MRRALVLVAVALGCRGPGERAPAAPPPAPPAGAIASTPGRVVDGQFASAALGVTKRYRAWLPAGYDADARRYPVIYLLHGLGGNERDWVDGGHLDQAAAALGLEAIVIMPDGDASFYVDAVAAPDPAACRARGNPFSRRERARDYCVVRPRYEAYVVDDLLAHVDATYRTIARRDGRGIGGLSMGGFGALTLAMRHPDRFAATASHSGVDALLYVGPHPYRADAVEELTDPAAWGHDMEPFGGYVRGLFGPDLANWQAHDPVALARSLTPGALAIYLDCGTEDVFALDAGATYLHDVLTARGVAHRWYLGPGRHDFSFWGPRLPHSLAFFAGALARPE